MMKKKKTKAEFIPKQAKFSRRKHSFNFDGRFWERLGEVAERHYGGNRSRAVEGMLLHDWMVETTKAKTGQEHTHWITAPLVLNPGELEPMLERLLRGDADAVGSFVDRLVEERAKRMRGGQEAGLTPDEG